MEFIALADDCLWDDRKRGIKDDIEVVGLMAVLVPEVRVVTWGSLAGGN